MAPKRRKLLSHTRPCLSNSTTSKPLSSPQTRHLIRTHHTLQKQLSAALAANDTEQASSLQTQIAAQGGLALYQRASLQGQSAERGGDSGIVLRGWIEEWLSGKRKRKRGEKGAGGKIRILEVGALRIDNACSRSSVFAVERIDLRSRHPGIETQDFMCRPLPATPADRFDIVSLSLVLNYVGTPAARGEMLQWVEKFLRPAHCVVEHEDSGGGEEGREVDEGLMPGLFLVLPAPCVANSRYLDERRLEAIMRGLGYVRSRRKMSAKLVYYLWTFVGMGEGGVGMGEGSLERMGASGHRRPFKKEEIRPGGKRNNFAIVLA